LGNYFVDYNSTDRQILLFFLKLSFLEMPVEPLQFLSRCLQPKLEILPFQFEVPFGWM